MCCVVGRFVWFVFVCECCWCAVLCVGVACLVGCLCMLVTCVEFIFLVVVCDGGVLVTCFVNAWCGSLYSGEFDVWMLFFLCILEALFCCIW